MAHRKTRWGTVMWRAWYAWYSATLCVVFRRVQHHGRPFLPYLTRADLKMPRS